MILVTGGTGLLGSHLLVELAGKHEKVVAVRRATSDLEEVRRMCYRYTEEPDALFNRVEWVEADLLNEAEVARVMQGIERVFHCAGMVSFNKADHREMFRFNVHGTANVVNACLAAGVKKLLHVSSSSAIGQPPEGIPATEELIWARTRESTGYAVSKFKSEMEVWRGIEEGLSAVIVNPTIILGAGFWNRSGSSMFTRVDRGLRFATPGITGYVDVRDVVRVMIRLMDSGITGERFIVSAGDYSFREILEMIARELGKPREMKLVSRSLLNVLSKLDSFAGLFTGKRLVTGEQVKSAFNENRFSSSKIREATGFEFTPVEETIAHVAGIYRAEHAG
jgi:dihydroflavonol-4-reductase